MLYRISKNPVNDKKIFPNIFVLGEWYIEYDNDVILNYRPAVKSHRECVVFELPDYPLWQHYWNPKHQVLDNYSNNISKKLIQLSPFCVCVFYPDGTNNFETYREDTYVPPNTGTNNSCSDVATEINKILTATLIDACNASNNWELYINGKLSTGILHSIVIKNNLPVTVVEDTVGIEWPATTYDSMCGPQQKFLQTYNSAYYNLIPQSKKLITGFMSSELTQTPSDVLLHSAEAWSIDNKEILVPYRNRDISYWVRSLSADEQTESVHKEIILLNNPQLLGTLT